jgi:flagellar FliL protein
MASEEKSVSSDGSAAGGGNGSKNKLGLIMQIGFVALNLVFTGGGAYLTYKSTIGWSRPQITEQQLENIATPKEFEVSEPFIYTMDKFNVNLGGEPKRSIRVEVNLEMLGKDGYEEVINTENRARARDRIVRVLNEKSFQELESIQGKLFLKDRIAFEVNSVLRTGVVKDVFFTDFVVQ